MSNIATTFRAIMLDGETIDTAVTVADRVRYDVTREGRGWPTIDAAGHLYVAFIFWAALRRTKRTDEKFDDWLENVADIEVATTEDSGANPTTPQDGLTSSSDSPALGE
jgi:hypothetical protein